MSERFSVCCFYTNVVAVVHQAVILIKLVFFWMARYLILAFALNLRMGRLMLLGSLNTASVKPLFSLLVLLSFPLQVLKKLLHRWT